MTVTLEQLEMYSSGEYEPWLSDKWKVLDMPAINGLKLPAPLIETVGLPFNTLMDRPKSIASGEIYFANGTRVGQFTMGCALTSRLHSLRYFDTWMQMVQNPFTGGFRLPSTYKKNVSVGLYDTKGKLIVTAEVRNCWPTEFSGVEPATSPSLQPLTVQFKCDAFRLIWSA